MPMKMPSIRFSTACRLLVLHWITALTFLILLAGYSVGVRFIWMNTVSVGLIALSLGLGVTSFVAMSSRRCDKCGARISDQLPQTPFAGIDGLVLDKRSRAVLEIAICNKYRCTICGHWN